MIQQIGLFPHMTVEANVATVPRLLGWDKERTRARARELLELVGLDPDEYAKRYPAQLSGGQRQRVGLARAMAADPPLMLMDEPFGAIDPITRERLQNDFLRLHREVRKTVVFVTHDIDEAIKMGDRICILREGGKLAQFDTPEEILAAPGRRLRGRLRRRRPRPQAPRAAPRSTRSSCCRCPTATATRGSSARPGHDAARRAVGDAHRGRDRARGARRGRRAHAAI